MGRRTSFHRSSERSFGCVKPSMPFAVAVQCGGCGLPSGSGREPSRRVRRPSAAAPSAGTGFPSSRCASWPGIPPAAASPPRRPRQSGSPPGCCRVVRDVSERSRRPSAVSGSAPTAAESATWRTVPRGASPRPPRYHFVAWHVGHAERVPGRVAPAERPGCPWRVRLPGLRVSPMMAAALRSAPNCFGAPRTCSGLPGWPRRGRRISTWDGTLARRTIHASPARHYSFFAKNPRRHRVRAEFRAPSLPESPCLVKEHPLSCDVLQHSIVVTGHPAERRSRTRSRDASASRSDYQDLQNVSCRAN